MTYHHICPGSLFIFVPQLTICRDCHNEMEIIIREKMKKNGNRPLEIVEYFEIWEEFTGEDIEDLYDKWKNKIRLRTNSEKKRRKKRKKRKI